jgi:hypothetical protein
MPHARRQADREQLNVVCEQRQYPRGRSRNGTWVISTPAVCLRRSMNR